MDNNQNNGRPDFHEGRKDWNNRPKQKLNFKQKFNVFQRRIKNLVRSIKKWTLRIVMSLVTLIFVIGVVTSAFIAVKPGRAWQVISSEGQRRIELLEQMSPAMLDKLEEFGQLEPEIIEEMVPAGKRLQERLDAESKEEIEKQFDKVSQGKPEEISSSSGVIDFQSMPDFVKANNPNKVIREVTAYNLVEAQTDGSPCIGSSGIDLCKLYELGMPMVATNRFKDGTIVWIQNAGVHIVLDAMNRRYAERIDVCRGKDIQAARNFSTQHLMVEELGYLNDWKQYLRELSS